MGSMKRRLQRHEILWQASFYGILLLMVLQRQVPVLKGYIQAHSEVFGRRFCVLYKGTGKSELPRRPTTLPHGGIMKNPALLRFPRGRRTDVETYVSEQCGFHWEPGTHGAGRIDGQKGAFLYTHVLQDETQLRTDLRELEQS